MKKILPLLLAASAVAVLVVWQRDNAGVTTAVAPPAVAPVDANARIVRITEPTAAPTATPASLPPTAAAPVLSRATRMSTAYYDATDLKTVIDNAASDPANGSYYYATLAVRECDQLSNLLVTSQDSNSDRGGALRTAMVERAKQRCANVPKYQNPYKELRALGDAGLDAGDSAFAAVPPMSTKRTARVTAQEYLQALYSTNDAGVTALVLQELAVGSSVLSLDGRAPSEVERSSMPAALALLGCDLGVPCDQRHPWVQMQCLGHGVCVDSLPALLERADGDLLKPYTDGTRYDYRTAVAMRDRIRAALAQGDCSALRIVAG